MRLLACLLILFSATLAPAAAPPGRVYLHGARLRLGEPRWRVTVGATAQVPPLPSPDRRRIATASGKAIEVYDVGNRRLLRSLPTRDAVFFPLAFSHSGDVLAVTRVDRTKRRVVVELWPVASGPPRTLHLADTDAPYTYPVAAAFLPGGKALATYDAEALVVRDAVTNTVLRRDRLSAAAPAFSPDGRWFAAQVGASVVLCDLVSGKWRRIALPAKKKAFAVCSFSPDGRLVAIATEAGRVLLHETATGRQVRVVTQMAKPLAPTAFSSDGAFLAVASAEAVQVFHAKHGTWLRSLRTPAEVLFFKDERRLISVEPTGMVNVWDARTGEQIERGEGHRADVARLAFSRDGRTLASIDAGNALIRWDVRTGDVKARMTPPGNRGELPCIALSLSATGSAGVVTGEGGETRVVAVDLDKRKLYWQEQRWTLPHSWGGYGSFGIMGAGGGALGNGGFGALGGLGDSGVARTRASCVVSPDGKLVGLPTMRTNPPSYSVVVRRNDGVRAWTFDASIDVKQAFSPDGRELALAVESGGRRVIRANDLQTGKTRLSIDAGPFDRTPILMLECSADGRVISADERIVQVWERASGAALDQFVLPKGFAPLQIVVTPAGRILVLGVRAAKGEASLTQVWDAGKGAVVFSTDQGVRPALCGRGRLLAVCWIDGSVLMFDVPHDESAIVETVDAKTRARLWDELASPDAATAWRARARLAAAPKAAVALLRDRLRPAANGAHRLADLGDDDFDVRETATAGFAAALARGDRTAEEALRSAGDLPSLEASRRVRWLLTRVTIPRYTRDELRLIRAIGLLDRIDTTEAKALLSRLAKGGPSLLTAEARAALERMKWR